MKWYSHLSICSEEKSGLGISWGASSNEDAGDCWIAQNKRAAVSEGHDCSRLSTGAEQEPMREQEETRKEQLRSMKKGRKWRFNGFVRAKESENWRRLSYRQWRKVGMAGSGKKGASKNLMCFSCTRQQKHKRSGGQRGRQRIVVREVVRHIKVDQEPDEVEKGRVIEREEVWKSSCD